MKNLFHVAAPLLALGILAACQQAPSTTPPSAEMSVSSEDNAVLIVNASAGQLARKVLAGGFVADPLDYDDLAEVRIALYDGATYLRDFKVVNPDKPYITAAFKNLRAQKTYTVKAAAYEIDPAGDYVNAVPDATAEGSIDVQNYTSPDVINLTLTLPDRPFNSTGMGGINIVGGEWEYPTATEAIQATTATPPSL